MNTWVTPGMNSTAASTTITMPATNITVTANYANHVPEEHGAKAPTCTAEGYTGDKVCRDCGEVLEKGESIPMLAHSYKDGTCTVCGAVDPNYKPTDPSDPTDPTEPTDPTGSDEQNGDVDKDDDNPQTGDDGNLILWLALLLASGTAVAAPAVYGRRKKREQ